MSSDSPFTIPAAARIDFEPPIADTVNITITRIAAADNSTSSEKGHRRSHTDDGLGQLTSEAVISRGISDPEYHNLSKGAPMTDDYLEMDKKSNRGKYRCGRCGQPKVRLPSNCIGHFTLLHYHLHTTLYSMNMTSPGTDIIIIAVMTFHFLTLYSAAAA
jgi:hypothetical protein